MKSHGEQDRSSRVDRINDTDSSSAAAASMKYSRASCTPASAGTNARVPIPIDRFLWLLPRGPGETCLVVFSFSDNDVSPHDGNRLPRNRCNKTCDVWGRCEPRLDIRFGWTKFVAAIVRTEDRHYYSVTDCRIQIGVLKR